MILSVSSEIYSSFFTLVETVLGCSVTQRWIKATYCEVRLEYEEIEGISKLELLLRRTFCFQVNWKLK